MDKVYFSKNKAKIVFSVNVENSVKTVSFSNFGGSYSTPDEKEQKAIEKSFYFKKGLIFLSEKLEQSANKEEKENIEPKEFPEVNVLNDAVSILRGDPYKVHHAKLKSKDAILTVAKELGISFPNLKSE